MPAKQTIFLFHGNDSLASSKSLRAWEEMFIAKHGEVSKYRIYADELNEASLRDALDQVLSSQGLFSEKRFCIIRRPTFLEKGNARGLSKTVVQALSRLVTSRDNDCTVVIWEDKLLPDTHPLVSWFIEHETLGVAKRHVHMVPTARQLVSTATSCLAEEGRLLNPDAQRLLFDLLNRREKELRILGELRSQEILRSDSRSWWLQQTIENLILLGDAEEVTPDDVHKAAEAIDDPVSVFEIANAVTSAKYALAHELLGRWRDSQRDEGQFFILFGILRKHFRTFPQGKRAIRLLADIEIYAKNGILPVSWLADLFLLRMEQGGNELLSPRLIWLSKLPAG